MVFYLASNISEEHNQNYCSFAKNTMSMTFDRFTILNSIATLPGVPGVFMIFMGLGVAPMDEKMAMVASPFIDPFGIPVASFLLFLGSCKILGALSLWDIGPMPKSIGRIGLMTSAAAACFGHYTIGDSIVPPAVFVGIYTVLILFDKSNKGKKE